MIEQTLSVVAVKGNTAYLQAQAKPSCEGCNGKCGSQVFAKLFGTDKKSFPYHFATPLQIGQKVKLALDDSRIVSSSFTVYMLPLLSAILAAILAQLLFGLGEPAQLLLAIVAGVCAFFVAKWRLKNVAHEVKVIKIYPISLPLSQIEGD